MSARIDIVVKGTPKGFWRKLNPVLVREIRKWGRELNSTLNAKLPRRVKMAPEYGRSGRPQRFCFQYSPTIKPPGFQITVSPPSRAIAVLAMEFGSTRPIRARDYGVRALQIVKKGGKPGSPINKITGVGENVVLRASRSPSRASPWFADTVYQAYLQLKPRLRKAIDLLVLDSKMEEII